MTSEAQARITINALLEQAGWRFQSELGKSANIVCEHRVTKKTFIPADELGRDFEHAPSGFIDYLLLDDAKRPVAVVEAKRESIDPLTAKEQARGYAESLGVSHIFLSNGLVHYYWNLRQGNPTKVSRFLPLEELVKSAQWKPDAARLAAITVDENFIAISQDAAWLSYSAAERQTAMVNKKIRLLRDYQIAAAKALQKTASATQHRFLFEMATGTGKTMLAAAIAKLYLRTENATRVLFLVDRLELENQACKNFTAYLANDGIETIIYKQKRQDWIKAQVVVTTIQSLATRNRFLHEFSPTDFQLIISDEAHRTISGNNRAIFEYFVGAKLGLTATPRDYLKGLDEDASKADPREYERRLLLDTYQTFGCPDGKPTFRYGLLDAVKHQPPYLCNPLTFDARTEITTELLSKEGYVVTKKADEDGQEEELVFGKKDYERRFFSNETNLSFVRCFLDNAKRDPITGEIGKTIMFAVSRKHATKLVTILNEEAAIRWPSEYGAGSTFAVQVTSDISDAQRMTIDFANNNLNGKSKFQESKFRDYNTSRTRVCITVGMMTTGYDCEDLLNVVLARPIFSPTDFIQIKGRGTRLFIFNVEGREQQAVKKDSFALFDFFANCEFFEKDFDYDRRLELPKERGEGTGGGDRPHAEDYTNTSPDPMALVAREAIGTDGMRIDREMYRDRFAQQVREALDRDANLRDAVQAEDWTATETSLRKTLLDIPGGEWSITMLQDSYKTDRLPSLKEILSLIFGYSTSIATRSQLADQEFERFVATSDVNAVNSRDLRKLFESFVLDEDTRSLLVDGQFGQLRARDPALFSSVQRLPAEEREALVAYVKARVPLNQFAAAV